jgi:hypothetical protein
MDRCIIDICIHHQLGTSGSSSFARWGWDDHCGIRIHKGMRVVRKLIRNKQRFLLGHSSLESFYEMLSLLQCPLPDHVMGYQSSGNIDRGPYPALPLAFFCLQRRRALFFLMKTQSSSSCTSVMCKSVSKFWSTRLQCSPAFRIMRLTPSLLRPNSRAVALTPTPSATWSSIWRMVSREYLAPKNTVQRVSAKRFLHVVHINNLRASLP